MFSKKGTRLGTHSELEPLGNPHQNGGALKKRLGVVFLVMQNRKNLGLFWW